MQDKLVAEYIAKYVNDDQVRREDRTYFRDVLEGVLSLDPLNPSFRVKIRRIGSHYHVLIKGWQSPMRLKKFSAYLCDSRRDALYNCVRPDVAIIPEDNGGPALVMHVNQDNAPAKRVEPSRAEVLERARIMADVRSKKRTFAVKDNVKDEEVDAADREYVHELLCDFMLWDPELPPVKVKIVADDTAYTCLFTGWTRELRIQAFSEEFVDSAHRGSAYDAVLQDAEVLPARPGDGGPYLVLRIQRGFRSARITRRR